MTLMLSTVDRPQGGRDYHRFDYCSACIPSSERVWDVEAGFCHW